MLTARVRAPIESPRQCARGHRVVLQMSHDGRATLEGAALATSVVPACDSAAAFPVRLLHMSPARIHARSTWTLSREKPLGILFFRARRFSSVAASWRVPTDRTRRPRQLGPIIFVAGFGVFALRPAIGCGRLRLSIRRASPEPGVCRRHDAHARRLAPLRRHELARFSLPSLNASCRFVNHHPRQLVEYAGVRHEKPSA